MKDLFILQMYTLEQCLTEAVRGVASGKKKSGKHSAG